MVALEATLDTAGSARQLQLDALPSHCLADLVPLTSGAALRGAPLAAMKTALERAKRLRQTVTAPSGAAARDIQELRKLGPMWHRLASLMQSTFDSSPSWAATRTQETLPKCTRFRERA